ncbi:MAG: hypothetical protein CM1200mP41_17210 [Gammaproteobacteria bacterium]|nr:MAG: hypothetical protein CM1200mP41_17210 [Gammaproteobacteria bacterium]
MHTLGSALCPWFSRRWPALPRHGTISQPAGQTGKLNPCPTNRSSALKPVRFAKAEGILPPEATTRSKVHSTKRCVAKQKALPAILFNLCGHGYFDMQAYSDFASGKLHDHPYDESEVAMALPVTLGFA